MTDTGQVPGEGLPSSAGAVDQAGVAAPGAYTYLDPAGTTTEDDDLLFMPGAQGAWTEGQPGYAPQAAGFDQPRTPGYEQAAAPAESIPYEQAPQVMGGQQPSQSPQSPQSPHEQQAVAVDAQHRAPDAQDVAHQAVPQEAAAPEAEAQAPGPHEMSGRDSGSVNLADVRVPGPASSQHGGTHGGQQPASAQSNGHGRRPLHLGPPAPAATTSPVRSLADRGPATATPPHPVRVRDSGQTLAGPEYLDVPRAENGVPQEPQLGEIPLQGAMPWSPQPPQVPQSPQVPQPSEVPQSLEVPQASHDGGAPLPGADGPVPGAETVVPEAAPVAPVGPQVTSTGPGELPVEAQPVGEFVPVEGSIPSTPHLAPTPPQPLRIPQEEYPERAADEAPEQPEPVQQEQEASQVPAPRDGENAAPDAAATPQHVHEAEAETEIKTEPATESTAVEQPAPAPEAEAAAPAEAVPAAEAPAEQPAPQAPEPEAEPAPEQQTQPVPQAQPVPEAQPLAAEPQPEAAPEPEPEQAPAPEPVQLTEAPEATDINELVEVTEADDAVAEPVPAEAPEAEATEPAPVAVAAAEEIHPTEQTEQTEQSAEGEQTAEGEQGEEAEEAEAAAEGSTPAPEAPSAEIPAAAPAPAYDDAEREAVLRVMRERRDIRNGFRSDPIPHDVLLRVLEAAHTAPSVGHSQPWDFVVIRSAETRRTMHELAMRQKDAYAKSLPKGRAKQFKELKIEAILDTPVNIVVTADPTRGGRHTLGRHTQPQMAPYSSALAVENLWLAARAEGLGVGWVSFFDEREMVRTLGLPEHLEVVAYLCVGYVDEFPDEPELMQAGWSKRRPLSWVVHEETYGRRALPGEEPHDLLAETVANIRPLDAKALGEAWERQKRMTKPAGALGMLEIISAQLAGLSRMCPPPIPEPAAVAIFAGDHGVHAQGVTPWPQEVTGQMVANFLGGGAVCNAFANQVGAEVCIVDVGVASDLPATPGLLPRKVRAGTADMTTGPALTREEVKEAIEVGIDTARDLVAAGNKALLTGEMGIANTTASAALISVFTGADPAEVTGRGTGVNDETLARKTDVVRRALELHQPDPADPIGVLAAVGGLEHAAMVGLLLGGASLRTPVILDGVSAGAAALVARAVAPEVLAACIAGHRSAEPGHVAALNKLGLRPLVDLDLRLGEGTGALLALPVVQSAARAMHEVATFDSAGVTEK
ncbi:nicotinate-nucleotide--dimethylbenzimidazole phosphoribosyltransferase [Streptomyces luteolus]|uniref:Nicotinate-nucleotide--dimethylbenzimidazole phosphoribosyltransferase n=1 Tax=Streptomyces luteolus TaxID=3043615 RepID=A0ABT6SXE2_9ACTN|nr:nicotinate-nucleotide--dimethylbenzimidazole phosphoribosyltransferase [Streptomyces sp. B-S-A12]MDI3420261.1 nicotinate-nucleotide--dimethylbenzimidazole phosphoribosyltransferase [Streptomyces sp. B-S-A12]